MNPSIVLIIIHFFADFFCQTDEMAMNKSKSNYWLSIHVGVYTVILALGLFIWLLVNTMQSPWSFFAIRWDMIIYFILLNSALHWITDFFTSKCTSFLYQKAEKHPLEQVYGFSWRHWFFTMIGVDQVIHYICLIKTYQYFIHS